MLRHFLKPGLVHHSLVRFLVIHVATDMLNQSIAKVRSSNHRVSLTLRLDTVCVTYGNACCDGTSERCCMTGVGCVSSGSICSSATGDNAGAVDGAGLPDEMLCPEVKGVAAKLAAGSVLDNDCAPT